MYTVLKVGIIRWGSSSEGRNAKGVRLRCQRCRRVRCWEGDSSSANEESVGRGFYVPKNFVNCAYKMLLFGAYSIRNKVFRSHHIEFALMNGLKVMK